MLPSKGKREALADIFHALKETPALGSQRFINVANIKNIQQEMQINAVSFKKKKEKNV